MEKIHLDDNQGLTSAMKKDVEEIFDRKFDEKFDQKFSYYFGIMQEYFNDMLKPVIEYNDMMREKRITRLDQQII